MRSELSVILRNSGERVSGELLGLLVIRVLAARVAKLGELKATGRGLLVLGRGVVPVLAIRALEGNDLAHCRYFLSLSWPATSAGKQCV